MDALSHSGTIRLTEGHLRRKNITQNDDEEPDTSLQDTVMCFNVSVKLKI